MLLSLNVAGLPNCGADVGGFFGNPEPELLVRWYQAGIFEPFFRAHAHSDTKRREPYLLGDAPRASIRRLLQLRYELLPVWYTAFWHAGKTGVPVLQPMHLVFPHDTQGFDIGDQYFVGDSLLVKPAVTQGADRVEMYLAERGPYYHYTTGHVYRGAPNGRKVSVPAPLDHHVPLLQRGGTVVPILARARRAAELQANDPYTLRVALRSSGGVRASGILYIDDGQTFAYEGGAFVARRFDATQEHRSLRLSSRDLRHADLGASSDTTAMQAPNAFAENLTARVERVIVYGLESAPKKVVVHDGQAREVRFTYTPAQKRRPTGIDTSDLIAATLVIHNPATRISSDWDIEIM